MTTPAVTTQKTMTIDAFMDNYKPVKNHFNEAEETESFQSRVYDINDIQLAFIKAMLTILPKQVWTVLEVGGTTIISSGYHFVDRAGYMITEVPADAELIQAQEPTEEQRFNIALYIKNPVTENAQAFVEELIDGHINEVIHELHYTENHEIEFGEANEHDDDWKYLNIKLSIIFGENEMPLDDSIQQSLHKLFAAIAEIRDVNIMGTGRLIHSA